MNSGEQGSGHRRRCGHGGGQGAALRGRQGPRAPQQGPGRPRSARSASRSKNHMSNLDVEDVARVKRALDKERQANLVEERLSSTVIRRRTKDGTACVRRAPAPAGRAVRAVAERAPLVPPSDRGAVARRARRGEAAREVRGRARAGRRLGPEPMDAAARSRRRDGRRAKTGRPAARRRSKTPCVEPRPAQPSRTPP